MQTVRVGLGFTAGILGEDYSGIVIPDIDVLVFPELVDGGYAALKRGQPPHTPTDRLMTLFRDASRKLQCTIVAGSVRLQHGTRTPTNSSLVFYRGKLRYRYDKIHLFKPTADQRYFQAGELIAATFKLATRAGRLRSGILICYDLRFPELTRAMALRGMDVLFVPARWPSSRDTAWQTLLRARAIENQIFVAGCNAIDTEGGYSYVFDPLGELVFSNRLRKSDQFVCFELNLAALREARRLHDNLKDARFLRQYCGTS